MRQFFWSAIVAKTQQASSIFKLVWATCWKLERDQNIAIKSHSISSKMCWFITHFFSHRIFFHSKTICYVHTPYIIQSIQCWIFKFLTKIAVSITPWSCCKMRQFHTSCVIYLYRCIKCFLIVLLLDLKLKTYRQTTGGNHRCWTEEHLCTFNYPSMPPVLQWSHRSSVMTHTFSCCVDLPGPALNNALWRRDGGGLRAYEWPSTSSHHCHLILMPCLPS